MTRAVDRLAAEDDSGDFGHDLKQAVGDVFFAGNPEVGRTLDVFVSGAGDDVANAVDERTGNGRGEPQYLGHGCSWGNAARTGQRKMIAGPAGSAGRRNYFPPYRLQQRR